MDTGMQAPPGCEFFAVVDRVDLKRKNVRSNDGSNVHLKGRPNVRSNISLNVRSNVHSSSVGCLAFYVCVYTSFLS